MVKKNNNPYLNKYLLEKVHEDKTYHGIHQMDDQKQLASIIQQFIEVPDEVQEKLQEGLLTPKEREAKRATEKEQHFLAGHKTSASGEVDDEEIEEFLDRFNEFDFATIMENRAIYRVYVEKLKYYKYFPNFQSIISKQKYFNLMVAQLDNLSTDIVKGEQEAALEVNIQI